MSRACRPGVRRYAPVTLLLLGTVGWLPCGAAGPAMPMRDPTLPPAALRAPPPPPPPRAAPVPGAAAVSVAPSPSLTPRTLLVVDGRRFVVEQGRRRGVGDTLGNGRIERIDETAVWVRQHGSLRALPMYGSVVKRTPAAAGALPLRSGSTPASRPDQTQLEKTPVTGESP